MNSAGNRSVPEEPIALVGISCRLPGAAGPRQLWDLLRDGRSAVTETPDDRRGGPGGPGDDEPSALRWGAFLEDVDRFDAGFFGIGPREAAAMDPQQRLALELSWEAFEDAGIRPETWRSQDTAVFLGVASGDYGLLLDRRGPAARTPHTVAGTQRGMTANRVSYALGLHGPSLTVDAGQASSLAAVHLACESLRRGDSALAVAGGVHLNLLPDTAHAMAGLGALSPDGRCFTFDERANGYVRGEGGAMVVLKPLGRALADGDPVYGVLLGSALNNDGGGEGLTVPARAGQEEVLRRACARAGVDPAHVQYVELHGTGTRVGDPVEAAALGAVFGAARTAGQSPLHVGSVKTNVGHLEAAAGVVGLVKVALSLQHATLPPSLGFRTPNPLIDMDALRLRMVTDRLPWTGADGTRLAGVSSFGLGGTNCHVVLSQPPAPAVDTRASADGGSGVVPWVLSGATAEALRAQADRLRSYVAEEPDAEPADVALALATTRATREHRAVVVAADREEFLRALTAAAEPGGVDPALVRGSVAEDGEVTFVYPGQGSQWDGMARELLDTSAVFRERMEQCDRALRPHVDWSLLDVLRGTPDAPPLERVDVVQPVLWAMMLALTEVWGSFGVRPDAVVGHSQGEIAAACVAGALSVEDGAKIVALRSRALGRLAGTGAMATVSLPVAQVRDRLERGWDGVEIAAVNGPVSTVVSGPPGSVDRLLAEYEAEGVWVRAIPVDYASHSGDVEVLRDALLTELAGITPRRSRIPFCSTVTGEITDTTELDAGYWYRNLRRPVRMETATRHLLEAGHRTFVEVSPHPVLTVALQQTVGAAAAVTGTLRRGEGGPRRLLDSVARLHVRGARVDWQPALRTGSGRRLRLPTYPFQRQSYWLDGEDRRETVVADGRGPAVADRREPFGAETGAPAPGPSRPGHGELTGLVREHAAAVLGHPEPGLVDTSRRFKDLGFDSLDAVNLLERLTAATGVPLPPTLIFDHPTPALLAEWLRTELAGERTDTGTAPLHTPHDDEPIAIVGMGCRYPGGVRSPEDLWRLVSEGRDAISGLPEGRGWDLEHLYDPDPDAGEGGRTYTRGGGFLHDADLFDAGFFGVPPREAEAMDPQQRLLLEVSWEALERAGIRPDTLKGSATGVFTGVMTSGYRPAPARVPVEFEGHVLTGNESSVASGRVSYVLGLEGPALSVDTACSSSLVALHLAVQSLRRGECSMALAGGVTVMAAPATLIEFARHRGLSPDGRCRAFGEGAEGTGFGEGCGVLVLERLSDARRAGRQVLGVVRGSAVNQDGASNGLTAPSGRAQVRVVRGALADAGLAAGDVDAVEAHGTGTRLGDPIEAQALLSAYGAGREVPLWLGSVKSNIGHTQAAAGVAGVMKMVLAMRHGVLPRTLHAEVPSSHVDWSSGGVELLGEAREWPEVGRPRRAGVSSFGISGTNAHVIVEGVAEEATASPDSPVEDPDVVPWVVSGRSVEALRAQAGRLAEYLTERPEVGAGSVGWSLVAQRSLFEQRAVVTGAGREELLAGLRVLAEGGTADNVTVTPSTTPPDGSNGLALLFTGQGAQRLGMGRSLHRDFPVFAKAFDEACAQLDAHLPVPLKDVVFGTDAELLDRTLYAQSALFALETAQFRLLEHYGIRPDHLLGHSVGEVAAAHVAGVLDLPDAALMVATRGRLMQAARGDGAMIAVEATEQEVLTVLGEREDLAGIAAVNGPRSVVVSGDAAVATEVADHFAALGRRTRRLRVSHAFHSPHMDSALEEFRTVLEGLTFRAPVLSVVSNVTGREATAEQLCSPDYWVSHIRRAVRFGDGVEHLAGLGVGTYLELGPDGVLTGLVPDCLPAGTDAVTLSLLRARRPESGSLLTAVAQAAFAGHLPDWSPLFPGARPVELPTYAFQHRSYWLTQDTAVADVASAGLETVGHPLLGAAVERPEGRGWVFTGRLSPTTHPWTEDHVIGEEVLLPGVALLDVALAAGARAGCRRLDELTLEAPLSLHPDAPADLRVVLDPEEEGRWSLAVFSRSDDTWRRHATGVLAAGAEGAGSALTDWPPKDATPLDVADAYQALAARGYDYGPTFQGLRAAWRDGDVLYAEVGLPAGVEPSGFGVHPAVLDAALHLLVLEGDQAAGLRLPFAWSGAELHATGATALRVRLTPTGTDTVALAVCDAVGAPVATVEALTLRPYSAAGGGRTPLFAVDWVPVPDPAAGTAPAGPAPDLPTDPPTDRWAVLGTRGPDLPGVARHADLTTLSGAVEDLEVAVLPWTASAPEHEVPSAAHDAAREVLGLLKSWLAEEHRTSAPLVVLTRNAVAVEAAEGVADLAASVLWGLLRTAQTEHPGRFVLLDADADPTPGLVAAALATGEPQLALRNGTLKAARLTRQTPRELLAPPEGAPAWRMEPGASGSLDALSLRPRPEALAPLLPGEVRVAVRAAGLNFRDALNALGLYPGDAGPLGIEGAGVVTEVGPGVTGFAPGDRVMGLLPGAFGPVVATDSRMLVTVPDGWTFAQAAAVPVVFLTAYYALTDLAALAPGQSLLVHAAAGGVGMAAVQLAHHLGARVFGTASPGKWDALRSMGLPDERIASSRDLLFEQGFRRVLGEDGGFDVVLNALAHEYVDASLRLLRPGGRFLEMGKTDVRDPASLPDVSYQAFDLMVVDADRIQEMLTELVRLFEAGALTHLPLTVRDVRRGREAFRHISQGRHTGKNVLTLPASLDPEGAVLVVGGTGVLGALLARHLVVACGVRHLVLVSRRGVEAPGAVGLRDELLELGARTVVVRACDAADRTALGVLVDEVVAERPLTGVFHVAGVLRDGVLVSLGAEALGEVLRSKVDGAWALHEVTRERCPGLAAFVVYSSVSGLVGTAGQANYAAANTFLDALAQERSARGLPGLSLAWGLWEQESGMTAGLDDTAFQRFERYGIGKIPSEQGMALFDEARQGSEPAVAPLVLDPARLHARAAVADLPPLLRGLVSAPARRTAAPAAAPRTAGASTWTDRIAGAAGGRGLDVVTELLCQEIADVLGHPGPGAIDTGAEFRGLGLDSLTLVELRNRLNAATGLRLPVNVLFDQPTPDELAAHLLAALEPEQPDPVSRILADADRMEEALKLFAGEREDRTRVTTRLTQILRAWQREQDEPAESADDLDHVTDDELFDALDNELSR
ncbi:beta-ketoacyl synthase N-terminal-like domain-containing protein [Kitasatospora sp. NPDC058184]|uniref:beta-ketoacyl synthase N-terminal-like domain-containing protein n=1 Tax=Kitasatospora sp. NPDC058184 TaxID=3346370 RepID=UPI0036D8DA10